MQFLVVILLASISFTLFWAWRKRKISNDALNALAGIFTVIAGVAAIIVFIVPSAQPNAVDNNNSIILTAVAQATTVSKQDSPTAGIPKCEWLLKNFPQTLDGVAAYFGIETYRVQLNYAQCASGAVVNGAIISKRKDWGYIGLFTPNGGCLDGIPEESSQSDYKRQLDNGYYRFLSGYLLSREPITFWSWCDELH